MIDDFGLIVSSFQSQYGIRISREAATMRWTEFRDLLAGLNAETALGRVISIRAEDNPDVLKTFSPEQRNLRAAWRNRRAQERKPEDTAAFLAQIQKAFAMMASGKGVDA